MYKIVGGILIVICSYLIGKNIVGYRIINSNVLNDFISFFKVLQEQLTTNYIDISEAIILSCEKSDFLYKKDLICFANMIQKCDNDTFKKAFENSRENYTDISLGVINEFANKLDENGLMFAEKACTEMINLLCDKVKNEKDKFVSDNKIIMSFSIFTGILIVIILM